MSNLQEAVAAAESLMDLPGVVGVGEGKRGAEDVVVVLVATRTPDLEKKIPPSIKGVPTDIRESGRFQAGG